MNTLLDNLFARRPKIHYVCPPICGVQFVPTSSGAPAVSFADIAPQTNCVNYWLPQDDFLQWDPYPGAICYNVYMASVGLNPDEGLPPCVTYFLTQENIIESSFTWDPYPNATSYNVYRALAGNPSIYVKTQSNIPVSVLSIDNEHVIVTAVTPTFETPTCTPIYYKSPCSPELADWLARVAINGGAVPSESEQLAVCQFIADMKAAALWDRMYSINHFSPTDKPAAYTWLKSGQMSDTWAWNNPAQEVNRTTGVNGLYTAGDFMDTAVSPSQIYSLTNCGVTGYASLTTSGGTFSDILGAFCGAYDAPNQDTFSLHPWKRSSVDPVFGYSWGNCWKFSPGLEGTPALNQAANKGCGYVSMSRTDINTARMYYAASNSPHSEIGSNLVSSPNVPPTGNLRLFSDVAQSNVFIGTCSFLAFHEAFTAEESATLFGIVQAFRIALGGGYV